MESSSTAPRDPAGRLRLAPALLVGGGVLPGPARRHQTVAAVGPPAQDVVGGAASRRTVDGLRPGRSAARAGVRSARACKPGGPGRLARPAQDTFRCSHRVARIDGGRAVPLVERTVAGRAGAGVVGPRPRAFDPANIARSRTGRCRASRAGGGSPRPAIARRGSGGSAHARRCTGRAHSDDLGGSRTGASAPSRSPLATTRAVRADIRGSGGADEARGTAVGRDRAVATATGRAADGIPHGIRSRLA